MSTTPVVMKLWPARSHENQEHAPERVLPARIGVLGFSAGGHLAARLSADHSNAAYPRKDAADERSSRPDFCALIYPAYLAKKKTGQVAPELPIATNIPPTFILQTKDDGSFVAGTTLYAETLKRAGVSCEFHLFEKGGHGYGLRPSEHPVSNWPHLCEQWLRTNSVLTDISGEMQAEANR